MTSSRRRLSRGFTLIEAMIVVAIVGVLALLAAVAYRRWVRSSYLNEAQSMVANIRNAEEAFYAENGAYLNVTGTLGKGSSYPSQNPGAFTTAWGAPCGWCTPANGYAALNVQPNAPVMFGYSTVAGDGVKVTPSIIGTITINGKALNTTAMNNNLPFYFVEADANISGDGVSYMHVYGMSGNNQIFTDEEGN
jgi:prepilin-type N-terminal cleavage/methylation domain-containing protein